MADFVHPGKVDALVSKPGRVHPAANVHADHIGHCFSTDGHGSADGAALSSVHIRHDSYAAALCEGLIAHGFDLLLRDFIDYGRDNDLLLKEDVRIMKRAFAYYS